MNSLLEESKFLTKLSDAFSAQQADIYSINKLGINSKQLMKNAGYCIAKEVESLADNKLTPILIVCGFGNNGGDGWIAGNFLFKMGFRIIILSLSSLDKLSGDIKYAAYKFKNTILLEQTLKNKSFAIYIQNSEDLNNIIIKNKPQIIIDAIFGTGLKEKTSKYVSNAINNINNYKKSNNTKIISIDIPSGIFCDGSNIHYTHIVADYTVTFSRLKLAHLIDISSLSCGKVICKNIGVKFQNNNIVNYFGFLAKDQPPISLLNKLAKLSYKNSFGHLAVLEGSFETCGASRLAALAGLRSGCGLVTLIVNNIKNIFFNDIPELMHQNFNKTLKNNFFQKINSIVLGPGLGLNEKKQNQAKCLIKLAMKYNIPVVIDADALFLLKNKFITGITIIATPHIGEAAKLLNISISDVQNNKIQALKLLLKLPINQTSKVIWVLKDVCSIIGVSNDLFIVCEGFAPSLSIAGSGDVLSGIVGSFLSQGYTAINSVLLGVGSHFKAGRILQNTSIRGHLASDIANILPTVLYN